LQPEVGHEVLWVIRDCLSGTVVLARALLSSTAADLTPLLCQAAESVGVPVTGVVSDGQRSIRTAVARALPGVPHQLCHFHYLREAAHPIFEADRHAKKELTDPRDSTDRAGRRGPPGCRSRSGSRLLRCGAQRRDR
jgi:hypothetical protein